MRVKFPESYFIGEAPETQWLGSVAFQGPMEKKIIRFQATDDKTEINSHLINCLKKVTLCQCHC